MSVLSDTCCICLQKSQALSCLDTADTDDVKLLKKLTFCVPNETWKPHYEICNLCTHQLSAVYVFVQTCISSEEFRKSSDLGEFKVEHKEEDEVTEEEQKFTCDHCGKTFRQKRYLCQHITKLHVSKSLNENTIKVEDEDRKSPVEDLKADIENEDFPELSQDDPQDSTYSEKSETEEDDFEEKLSKKSTDKRKSGKKEPQKCGYCPEVFQKRQDWIQHMRTEHELEKPYACDQCDAKYMNRYSLLIHSRKHKNEKPFICATCGKSFVSSADLNHHTKIHDINRAYPCPMCDRSFKTHSNLRTHRLQMHLDPAEWKFHCNLCNKKFPIRGNLMKHLKRHAGIKEFDCHICEKKFVNKAELTLHMNTHTNQRLFKCNLCGKDYKNREGLRRHMKVVHDQGNWKAPKSEKKYLCPMCPKIFAVGNKLQRHIFTHTGEKPFKCDYCQKRFIDKYGRKVHYKKDHNLEIFA